MPRKKKNQLPSGNYRYRVYVGERADGSKRYESFSGSDPVALKAEVSAFRIRVRQLRGEGVPVEDITRDGVVRKNRDDVQKYLDLYLDTCRAAGLSPSTMRGYERFAVCGYAGLSKMPVRNITIPDIQRYVNGLGKSPKTIRNYVSFLLAALKPVRPDLRVEMLRIPRNAPREMSIPSTDDVKRMIAAAKGSALYVPLLLAALMGLRRSEICGLKWSDVDLKGRTLTVRCATVRGLEGYVTKGTKTRAGTRTLPVPANVARALAADRGTDPRVTRLTPAAITCRFEDLIRPLGIACRFHDLRHYHASMMLAAGAPSAYIIADMGHASMEMVNRVYGHVMADKQHELHSVMEKKIADFDL